jgi:hypothetical protein
VASDGLRAGAAIGARRLVPAALVLEPNGPAAGRPLVDTVTASRVANRKDLRAGVWWPEQAAPITRNQGRGLQL